MQNTCMIKAGA